MTATTTKEAAIWMMVLFAALLIPLIPPTQVTQAADSHVEGTMIFPSIEEPDVPKRQFGVMAPGAAEDTLEACIGRIPELASVGQHMLAKQSCADEEKTRKAIRLAPKF